MAVPDFKAEWRRQFEKKHKADLEVERSLKTLKADGCDLDDIMFYLMVLQQAREKTRKPIERIDVRNLVKILESTDRELRRVIYSSEFGITLGFQARSVDLFRELEDYIAFLKAALRDNPSEIRANNRNWTDCHFVKLVSYVKRKTGRQHFFELETLISAAEGRSETGNRIPPRLRRIEKRGLDC